ncbi:MAG: ribonuclease HI family protein [Candidatus Yanofskybacteria bacterium]|nr:ribonuclease HI family protein [Candidatus Yanofskybacteria bacterium]
MDKYIIHTDGGARGNPGPAAIGVVISKPNGALKKHYSEYIGSATNNEAEYQAAIFALKKLKQLIGKEELKKVAVEVSVDSEFLERQVNGIYKVKEPEIQKLFLELWNLKLDFGEVNFKSVPREDNSEADELVNVALDKELNKLL